MDQTPQATAWFLQSHDHRLSRRIIDSNMDGLRTPVGGPKPSEERGPLGKECILYEGSWIYLQKLKIAAQKDQNTG